MGQVSSIFFDSILQDKYHLGTLSTPILLTYIRMEMEKYRSSSNIVPTFPDLQLSNRNRSRCHLPSYIQMLELLQR